MEISMAKLKKGSNGTIILDCKMGEETEKLYLVQNKLSDNYKVTEAHRLKPKVKMVNVDEKELKLSDDKLKPLSKNKTELRQGRTYK